jgi:hypothetical protein
MFTVNYVPENFWQIRSSKDSENYDESIQHDLKRIAAKETELMDLYISYINDVDKYYEAHPPFSRKNSNREFEKQDMDCFVRLVRQCMYSNNIFLIKKWGIDYIKEMDVLAKPKSFYKKFFDDFSDPNICLDVGIGEAGSAYFKYLSSHFPKD